MTAVLHHGNKLFRGVPYVQLNRHLLSQQYAQGETCYPVKLIYGHMMQLAEQGVDYIFLPSVRTMRHPHANEAHNYACPYMQTAAAAVFETLGLERRGIRLLSPVLDLDLGAKMMGTAMLDMGKAQGFSRACCLPGLAKGALAVKELTAGVEQLGAEFLNTLKPKDKVLALITRNLWHIRSGAEHGESGAAASAGMYWPCGDHLLSGAKLIARHPNLYAVYLTNRGCGPDTLIAHMFKEEMGDKTYLQLEVDEHCSRVGVVTRIEAFLHSLFHRPPVRLPDGFRILDVATRPANIQRTPEYGKKL